MGWAVRRGGAYRFAQNTQSALEAGVPTSISMHQYKTQDKLFYKYIQIQCWREGCQDTISKPQNKNNIPPPTRVPQREGSARKWRDHARNQSPKKLRFVGICQIIKEDAIKEFKMCSYYSLEWIQVCFSVGRMTGSWNIAWSEWKERSMEDTFKGASLFKDFSGIELNCIKIHDAWQKL